MQVNANSLAWGPRAPVTRLLAGNSRESKTPRDAIGLRLRTCPDESPAVT